MSFVNKRSRNTQKINIPALAALLLFFIPVLSLIPFWVFVDGFVPSMNLRPEANIFGIFAGLAFSALLWRTQIQEIKEHWFESRRIKAFKVVALIPFVPLFGAAIGCGFVHGPVNYALHSMSSHTVEQVTVHITSADHGGRRCRNKVLLEGDQLLWERKICGLSEDAVNQLHRGGYMQLQGTLSPYGMHVRRYAVVIR